jgi:hypothetical protein
MAVAEGAIQWTTLQPFTSPLPQSALSPRYRLALTFSMGAAIAESFGHTQAISYLREPVLRAAGWAAIANAANASAARIVAHLGHRKILLSFRGVMS